VLRGQDSALYPQAVSSLGGMQSKKAVAELMKIVCTRDLFLKNLSLKTDALAAIAVIGDHQVTPQLTALLKERHLLAAARGRELRIAIATCLGRLGDRRALPTLAKLAQNSGELGTACSNAIAQIEKTEGRPHGNS
jgi:HEAT repeat protein